MTAVSTNFPRLNAGHCLNPDCVRSAARQASHRLARPTWRAVVLSAVVSVAAHLSALAALVPNDSVEIAGGAPATLAALGNSFADFIQGATPVQPAPAERSAVEPAQRPEQVTAPAQPTQPASVQTAPVPEATALSAPESAAPVVPTVRAPDTPRPEATPSQPSALAPRPSPPEAAPVTPPETLASAPEVTVRQADASTTRPPRRPDPAAPAPARPRQETAQRTPPAPAPQAAGNAEQDARRGASDGAAGASAAASGSSGAAAQAGNAAVSNYPGQVMERIRRTRQQRVAGRGVAVVAFNVADSGALAGASIQRSSGNPAIDAAALAHIQRAAPFPAPPAGAGRNFSFEFVVR